jgi:hypothetical protein
MGENVWTLLQFLREGNVKYLLTYLEYIREASHLRYRGFGWGYLIPSSPLFACTIHIIKQVFSADHKILSDNTSYSSNTSPSHSSPWRFHHASAPKQITNHPRTPKQLSK